MRNGRTLFTILGKLSECGRVLAPLLEVAHRLKAMRGRIAIPKRFPPRRAGSAKFSKLMSRCEPL